MEILDEKSKISKKKKKIFLDGLNSRLGTPEEELRA